MTTITLKNGYYIEIDPLNYTLRQKYTGETKSGQKINAIALQGIQEELRRFPVK